MYCKAAVNFNFRSVGFKLCFGQKSARGFSPCSGISLSLSLQDSVPHVALLGSAGGQMAAVGLVGSLYQMEKEGLLDTVLYLGGSSGSAW